MNFELNKSNEILSRTPFVLESLLSGLSEEWHKNNEGLKTWSPYDIVGHLIHNELTDWMPRINIVLSNKADKSFEPFDRFAQFNNDQSTPIEKLLKEFRVLREYSLMELKSLEINNETLSQKGIHPAFGEVNLKELISAWVVHDLGHIGQIVRVMAKQYKNEVGPWAEYLGVLNH